MHNCSPRCSKIIPRRLRISRPPHKLKGYRSRCSRRRFWSFQDRSRYSPQNSPQRRQRTRGRRRQDRNQPQLDIDIGRPATRPRRRQTHCKIATYILEADSGSTQMGTAPPMVTRWRSPTHQIPIGPQIEIITSQLRD